MRPDFKKVSAQLQRLELYATEGDKFNMERWPSLKYESGDEMYSLGEEYTRIYGDGRDCAIWMSRSLAGFFDVATFPTLKSFVDSFENSWVNQIGLLEDFVSSFRAKPDEWRHSWAIGEMLKLFEGQIEILKSAKNTIAELKDSNTYRKEAGLPKKKKMKKQSINITGATNVINQTSIGDGNVQNATIHNSEEVSKAFAQLRELIKSESQDLENDLQIVDAAESEATSKSPKGLIVNTLLKSLSVVASAATIVGTIITAIS